MIDHRTAIGLSALGVDGPLGSDERDALRDHLAECGSCRAVDTALRRDAAALRRLDFGDAPERVRLRVADAAAAAVARRPVGARSLVLVVGLLLLLAAAVGGIAVGAQQLLRQAPVLDARDGRVHWRTGVVDFTANALAVEIGGRRFAAAGVASVDSDPGDAGYWTLELVWFEHGVEMRMNVYFRSDGSTWWVDELRTYDGHAPGDWLFYRVPQVRAPLGVPWVGNLDVVAQRSELPGRDPGRLLATDVRLSVTPGPGVARPRGEDPLAPVLAPVALPDELRCSGIAQLSPADAEKELLGRRYRVSWRLETATGPDTGLSEVHERAPAGVIRDIVAVGDRELIVFVVPRGDPRAIPMPAPADCPRAEPPAAASP